MRASLNNLFRGDYQFYQHSTALNHSTLDSFEKVWPLGLHAVQFNFIESGNKWPCNIS